MNNLTKLFDGREPLFAFDSEFKGKQYFHIRHMWFDAQGHMQPGKGISVPYDQRDELLTAIIKLRKPRVVKAA